MATALIYLPAGTGTTTLPANFSAPWTAYAWASGGGGFARGSNVGTGGGSGAYSEIASGDAGAPTLTALQVINCSVGAGGAGAAAGAAGNGAASWIGGTSLGTAWLAAGGGGQGGTNTTAGAGGVTTNSVGTVKRAGAAGGGIGSNALGSAGGGGAPGPGGTGGAGGAGGAGFGGSGGGGSGDTGGNGVAGTAPGVGTAGGNGGAAGDGTAGGLGGAASGSASNPGVAGTSGSGGGGGNGNAPSNDGGNGGHGNDSLFTAFGSYGPGGGGGGSGDACTGVAGSGGLFGGGGGGTYGNPAGTGGAGGDGGILIVYTVAATAGYLSWFVNGVLAGSEMWSGPGGGVAVQALQGQVAVLLSDGATILTFGAIDGVMQAQKTLTSIAPASCAALGATYQTFWAGSLSATWQCQWAEPFNVRRRRVGEMAVYNGTSWQSAALGIGHDPSALAWDASGNVWLATAENDLYSFAGSATGTALPQLSYELVPDYTGQVPGTPMGLSAMTWTNGGLYAATAFAGAVVRLK